MINAQQKQSQGSSLSCLAGVVLFVCIYQLAIVGAFMAWRAGK